MKHIHSAFMYIPYGRITFNIENLNKVGYRFINLEDEYNDITCIPEEHFKHIQLMTLFVRDAWGKRLFGLEQKFKAKFIPQYTANKPGFRYRHSDKTVIVTRLLGSMKPNTIDAQAKLLINECNRYETLYCKVI